MEMEHHEEEQTSRLDDMQRLLEEIPEELRSKYLLTLAVAERAKQILQQQQMGLTQRGEESPIIQALRDLVERRFQFRLNDERVLRAFKGELKDTDIFPYRP